MIGGVRFTKDGEKICVGGKEGKVRIWSVKDLCQKMELEISSPIVSLDTSLQGELLCVVEEEGRCLVWDIKQKKLVQTLEAPVGKSGGSKITGACFARKQNSSEELLFTQTVSRKQKKSFLTFWEKKESWEAKKTVHTTKFQTCMCVSPDGKLVAAGGSEGEVLVFDAQNLALRMSYTPHMLFVSGVAFVGSEKERHVLSVSGDRILYATKFIPMRLWFFFVSFNLNFTRFCVHRVQSALLCTRFHCSHRCHLFRLFLKLGKKLKKMQDKEDKNRENFEEEDDDAPEAVSFSSATKKLAKADKVRQKLSKQKEK